MSTTSLSSIQPQVLEANLKRATVPTAPPVEEPVAEPAGALASAVGAVARVAGGVFRRPAPAAAKLSPQGVPHGAVNVPVRMRNVRICNNGRGIAYCNSFGYEALAVVPKGDGMPYPPMPKRSVTARYLVTANTMPKRW